MFNLKRAVISAAGRGERMQPMTNTLPKEMLLVAGRPAIDYVVSECLEVGIEKIIIVIRSGDTSIKNYFKGKLFSFVEQDPCLPYGNGTPLLAACKLLDNEPFAYCLGDDLLLNRSGKGAVFQLLEYFSSLEKEMTVFGMVNMKKEKVVDYAYIQNKNDAMSGLVEKIIEKPKLEEIKKPFSAIGRLIFTNDIFEYLSPENLGKNGELWFTDGMQGLVRKGKVCAKLVEGELLTVGTPQGYIEANVKYSSIS